MNKDKISIQEIIDLVASKAGVSKRAAEEFLKVFISTIEDTLITGESVKIKDFGTFKLQWNEPRKSVNIQTGEEILLSGYHKVTFTPDTTLRDLVNEPFAHLEAVVLEDSNKEKAEVKMEEETEVELNPLRIFVEQASEIKNLISEIQALSSKSEKVIIEDKIESISEEKVETEINSENELIIASEEIEDLEKNSEDINYISEDELDNKDDVIDKTTDAIDNQTVEEESQYTEVEIKTENELETEKVVVSGAEFSSNPFIEASKPGRKTRKRLWTTIIIILLSGGGIAGYFFVPPVTEIVNNTLTRGKNLIITFKDSASTTDLLNMISKWVSPTPKKEVSPETIIVPKKTVIGDSIIEEEPIDSLQILFDTPRIYPELIATEKIVSGSRLARMSERYYGKSDFWVYIYEANQNRIPNPDNIPSGTLIYIPKVDPRLIDATNPRCIKKARELHDLYVKTDSVK